MDFVTTKYKFKKLNNEHVQVVVKNIIFVVSSPFVLPIILALYLLCILYIYIYTYIVKTITVTLSSIKLIYVELLFVVAHKLFE